MNHQGIGGILVAGFAFTLTAEQAAWLAMFLASGGGTYASFAWADPIEPRKKMINLFVSCIIMGMAFTLILNSVIEWQLKGFGLTVGARAGISAVVSCLTRFVMPVMIEGIKDGSWKSLIPFLGRKS